MFAFREKTQPSQVFYPERLPKYSLATKRPPHPQSATRPCTRLGISQLVAKLSDDDLLSPVITKFDLPRKVRPLTVRKADAFPGPLSPMLFRGPYLEIFQLSAKLFFLGSRSFEPDRPVLHPPPYEF